MFLNSFAPTDVTRSIVTPGTDVPIKGNDLRNSVRLSGEENAVCFLKREIFLTTDTAAMSAVCEQGLKHGSAVGS